MLGSAGYAVESRGAGDLALERLLDPSGPRVDLLLADIHLPGRSGPDVIAEARSRLSDPPACVFMTGSSGVVSAAEDRQEAILEKPFGAEELLAAVSSALAAHRSG
jgi:CheY-like chemotaxis protein